MSKNIKSENHILSIDHGTSGIKASLISDHGEVVASTYEKTAIKFLPKGGAEQDPNDWWQALVKATRSLLSQGGVSRENIVAIGVSSTFSSTVAVDTHGNHLMNSITWMDSRGAPYVRQVMGGFPSIKGYGLINLWRWIPKTGGGPTLSGKDDIAHVLLIKHEYPDIYEKTFKFLPSKDYLNLRLTGEIAASYDSMTLFWVTDTRKINNIRYDKKLIRLLNIDEYKLPLLKPSTAVLGTLTKTTADELGLYPRVQVVVCSPDHQSACIGSGAIKDYQGHLYIGTSSWIQCVVPFKKTDLLHSIASLPTAIPGRYYCANEQDFAGGCLSYLIDNIILSKEIFPVSQLPQEPYKVLEEIANKAPPGSNKLIFTPWFNGERTPVEDNNLRGGIFNISNTTTIHDFVRAFFEGVAYNNKWSLKYVERFIGRKLDPITIIGGGASSNLWCQIFADILDREIHRVKDPELVNARGAAFIAAVGLGFITFDDVPNMVEYDRIFKPNADNRKIYDNLFTEFTCIYKNNRAMYERLNHEFLTGKK